jgi:hypothetical protein
MTSQRSRSEAGNGSGIRDTIYSWLLHLDGMRRRGHALQQFKWGFDTCWCSATHGPSTFLGSNVFRVNRMSRAPGPDMFRVWQSATMAYGAIGESDIIAGRDSPIL